MYPLYLSLAWVFSFFVTNIPSADIRIHIQCDIPLWWAHKWDQRSPGSPVLIVNGFHHTYMTISHHTIQSQYIVVIYNTITHTEHQSKWYNFSQTLLHSQMTPHISPSRENYGVSFMRTSTKYIWLRYIESALYITPIWAMGKTWTETNLTVLWLYMNENYYMNCHN